MKAARTKQMIVVLVAVLSLLVSAVSACACTHHRTIAKQIEAGSCHGSSHSAMPMAEHGEQVNGPSTGEDVLDHGCSCFTRAPVTAIVSKSEKKQRSPEGSIAAIISSAPAIFEIAELGYAKPVKIERSSFLLSEYLRSSLPARAPPRA